MIQRILLSTLLESQQPCRDMSAIDFQAVAGEILNGRIGIEIIFDALRGPAPELHRPYGKIHPLDLHQRLHLFIIQVPLFGLRLSDIFQVSLMSEGENIPPLPFQIDAV
jgi:hypothetical protein